VYDGTYVQCEYCIPDKTILWVISIFAGIATTIACVLAFDYANYKYREAMEKAKREAEEKAKKEAEETTSFQLEQLTCGSHTFYLSRENATAYEYMKDVGPIYTSEDGNYYARENLMRDEMTRRLNELGEEGWIFLTKERRQDSSSLWYIEMFLKRQK